MAEPITFYFDFSSPYGYLAAHRIDPIARQHGRDVIWRPILLGAVFKLTGAKPLKDWPIKWDYVRREVARTARLHKIPFALPEPFPFAAVAASRAFYRLEENDGAQAKAFALATYGGAFAEGLDMSQPGNVARVATAVGADGAALLRDIEQPHWKDRLRAETDQAIARGVFGSPFFLVDGEPFWGAERLLELDSWLTSGGW